MVMVSCYFISLDDDSRVTENLSQAIIHSSRSL